MSHTHQWVGGTLTNGMYVGAAELFQDQVQPQVRWRSDSTHGCCEDGEWLHGEAAAEEGL